MEWAVRWVLAQSGQYGEFWAASSLCCSVSMLRLLWTAAALVILMQGVQAGGHSELLLLLIEGYSLRRRNSTLKRGKQSCAEIRVRLLALVGAHRKTCVASPRICFFAAALLWKRAQRPRHTARPSLAKRGMAPPNLCYLQVPAVWVGQVVCHPPTVLWALLCTQPHGCYC